jgi:hypothetical protein
MKITPDKWEYWHTVCSAIVAIAVVASLAWANLAEPRIDKKIDQKVDPIVEKINEALEYNNCLMTPPETREKSSDDTRKE